jgi:hypothetical protein
MTFSNQLFSFCDIQNKNVLLKEKRSYKTSEKKKIHDLFCCLFRFEEKFFYKKNFNVNPEIN